jgi:hypothetical protein
LEFLFLQNIVIFTFYCWEGCWHSNSNPSEGCSPANSQSFILTWLPSLGLNGTSFQEGHIVTTITEIGKIKKYFLFQVCCGSIPLAALRLQER